jgi:hypothetical protein
VLRVRAGDVNIRRHLLRAVNKVCSLYGSCKFQVTVTANVLLKSITSESYSVFFGQDFGQEAGRHDLTMGPAYAINNVADAADLPTELDLADFSQAFERIFGDTDVAVEEMISLVYKFTRHMSNFEKSWSTGERWRKLF